MRKCVFARHLVVGAILVVRLLHPADICLGQTKREASSNQEARLKKFLQDYSGEPDPTLEAQGPTRYSSALIDLKDDGMKEVVVYLTGRGWCGSGGCVMLILVPEGGSYKVITETTVTRLPIRILKTKSNGWHDLSVLVAGGGIQLGYEAILSFDGKTYPTNPTVPPAHPSEGKVQGQIVIPVAAEGKPLYQ